MSFTFDGVLFEIFSNLPSKALFQIATVCRDVHNLPSNEVFARKQSLKMQTHDDHDFLLQTDDCYSRMFMVKIHPLSSEDTDLYGISSTSLRFLSKEVQIISSSNGLLLCMNKRDDRPEKLIICNPSTHSWLAIPTPDGLNLGRVQEQLILDCNDGESIDYTLMALMQDSEAEWFEPKLFVKMFSRKESIWKTIGTIHQGQREAALYHLPLYDNSTDTIYILSGYSMGVIQDRNNYCYWPYIVCYNTKNSETKFLRIPKDARKGVHSNGCRMQIFKWGRGYLHLVQLSKGVFRVWVMKNKWIRVLKMRALAMIGRGMKNEINLVRGFTIMNGKSLLFATHDTIYRWDLTGFDYDQKTTRRVADEISEHEYGEAERVNFYSYSNTLRPCGKGAMSINQFLV